MCVCVCVCVCDRVCACVQIARQVLEGPSALTWRRRRRRQRRRRRRARRRARRRQMRVQTFFLLRNARAPVLSPFSRPIRIHAHAFSRPSLFSLSLSFAYVRGSRPLLRARARARASTSSARQDADRTWRTARRRAASWPPRPGGAGPGSSNNRCRAAEARRGSAVSACLAAHARAPPPRATSRGAGRASRWAPSRTRSRRGPRPGSSSNRCKPRPRRSPARFPRRAAPATSAQTRRNSASCRRRSAAAGAKLKMQEVRAVN